jgi:putative PIN family toxin of toxin-antitoxin system
VGKATTKVVLDTNILVSALGWQGNPHKLLQKVIDGKVILFISNEQFEELAKVLDYPKFNFSEEEKARFKALTSGVAVLVRPTRKLDIIKKDPSDNLILECALVSNADFIVSGDKHLLVLATFKGAKIVSAAHFMREFRY